MSTLRRSNWEWLQRHAEQQPDGSWICKETGVEIQAQGVHMSIWTQPGNCQGDGETKEVLCLWCPGCNPKPAFPSFGSPIAVNSLVEIAA